jgi:glycerol-3-phosphate acyltransferase PlsY
MEIVIFLLCSFLCGSIPFGLIISQIFYKTDIREHGSKNIGSTNVYRILGWKAGLSVQLLDIVKGFLPVYLLSFFTSEPLLLESTIGTRLAIGVMAVLGHIFSPFVKFKGGKGINTILGMLLGVSPIDISLAFLGFVLVFLSTGIISVSSMSAAVLLPLIVTTRYMLYPWEQREFIILLTTCCILSIVVFITHRSNIERLRNGTESSFEKFNLLKKLFK